jgi:hypothetical protein
MKKRQRNSAVKTLTFDSHNNSHNDNVHNAHNGDKFLLVSLSVAFSSYRDCYQFGVKHIDHIKWDLHLIVATGEPATFRPPQFILVSTPQFVPQLLSCSATPVQLAPAGIFPEQKTVTFLSSPFIHLLLC